MSLRQSGSQPRWLQSALRLFHKAHTGLGSSAHVSPLVRSEVYTACHDIKVTQDYSSTPTRRSRLFTSPTRESRLPRPSVHFGPAPDLFVGRDAVGELVRPQVDDFVVRLLEEPPEIGVSGPV